MEEQQKTATRKKFFLWGLGIVSSVTVLKFIIPKKKKPNTIKMLSEDGKLVEVDIRHIHKTGNKLSEKEIHTWIKNKPTL